MFGASYRRFYLTWWCWYTCGIHIYIFIVSLFLLFHIRYILQTRTREWCPMLNLDTASLRINSALDKVFPSVNFVEMLISYPTCEAYRGCPTTAERRWHGTGFLRGPRTVVLVCGSCSRLQDRDAAELTVKKPTDESHVLALDSRRVSREVRSDWTSVLLSFLLFRLHVKWSIRRRDFDCRGFPDCVPETNARSCERCIYEYRSGFSTRCNRASSSVHHGPECSLVKHDIKQPWVSSGFIFLVYWKLIQRGRISSASLWKM